MALQCRFAPAIVAVLIADFDEKPTWKDTEVLNGLNLGHFGLLGGKRGGSDVKKGKGGEEAITRKEEEEEYPCNRMGGDRELRVARLGATGTLVCRVPREIGTAGAFQFVRSGLMATLM